MFIIDLLVQRKFEDLNMIIQDKAQEKWTQHNITHPRGVVGPLSKGKASRWLVPCKQNPQHKYTNVYVDLPRLTHMFVHPCKMNIVHVVYCSFNKDDPT